MKIHDFLTKSQETYDSDPSQDPFVFTFFNFVLAIYTFLKPAK
ncbi:hypothetical protein P4388_16935 [Bacillus thuringiensis]|uniref:Uncharacterized protein n=1 Tax=Bacillus thuringiensis serovar toumanoffi TaxID=180862 RepID=A0ABD5I7B9_BACTU|nr:MULTISPECIES: hypothetical protein [Bacillus]MDW9213166.1 hypothetical protein [Bacillus thuringiensis serovar toumanoffi]MED1900887.1 hypothetical protein [Bacillus thuringiensis]MED2618203.1 hypothetical protein [Bacillus thuringiensis]MED3215028.1 hypothetical protein [Bacillus thuringiensis]MED3239079.1 hypothetical protein [Bacillus thuringiensis]